MASEAFGTDRHTHWGDLQTSPTHTHTHSHLKIAHTVLQVPQWLQCRSYLKERSYCHMMCTNSIIGQHVMFKWCKTNNIRQSNLLLNDPTYGKRMIYIYDIYIYKLILCEYTAIKETHSWSNDGSTCSSRVRGKT